MSKILDNPEEYFDSLSKEEFKNLLDEFGFEYEDISNLPEKEKELCLKGLDTLSENKGIQLSENDVNILKGTNTIYIIPKTEKPLSVTFENIIDQIASINDLKIGDKEEYVIDEEDKLNKVIEAFKELEDTIEDYKETEYKSTHKKKNKQVKNWERTKFYQR